MTTDLATKKHHHHPAPHTLGAIARHAMHTIKEVIPEAHLHNGDDHITLHRLGVGGLHLVADFAHGIQFMLKGPSGDSSGGQHVLHRWTIFPDRTASGQDPQLLVMGICPRFPGTGSDVHQIVDLSVRHDIAPGWHRPDLPDLIEHMLGVIRGHADPG